MMIIDMCNAEKQLTYGWLQILASFFFYILVSKILESKMSSQQENSDAKDLSGKNISSF